MCLQLEVHWKAVVGCPVLAMATVRPERENDRGHKRLMSAALISGPSALHIVVVHEQVGIKLCHQKSTKDHRPGNAAFTVVAVAVCQQ
jgi:hypothetical protein